MSKITFLLVFIILLIIALLFHYPMLYLGLTGDHLLAINEWRVRFIVPTVLSFKAFINPYGASAVLDKLIDWIWGFNPLPYFLISLLTKVLAATSAYFLASYLFKSKIISSMVGLAAILLFAGTEGNTPGATIYLSLFFLCLGFIKLFRLYDHKEKLHQVRGSLILVTYFLISFALTPARMYGLLPMVLIAEGYALITKKTALKFALLRLGIFFCVVFFFKKIGLIDSYGTASGVTAAITSLAFYQRTPNLPGLIFFMLGSFRQVFIPDIFGDLVVRLGYFLHITAPFSYILGLIPGVVLFLLIRTDRNIPKKWSLLILTLHCVILLGIMQFLSKEIIYTQIDVYIGGFIANILLCVLLSLVYQRDRLALSAATFFATPLIYMIVPYLLYRLEPQETLYRYFSPSSFMGAIILGYLIYVVRRRSIRLGTIFMVICLGIVLYNATLIHKYYASSGEAGAYNSYLVSNFDVMNKELGNRHGKSKPIVFVRGDDFTFLSIMLNQGSLRFSLANDSLTDNAQPMFITDKELFKEIYIGSAPVPYKQVTDINTFYGFEIKNKKAYSITPEIREYLLKAAH